jgi:catechol 2,3-dioxygenase-like lactoylglutathione lyase family enzyme
MTHVRLLVDEYERCFRFYADTLGLESTFGDATSGYADFDTASLTRALHDAGELTELTGGGPRGRDGAALIPRVENVEEAVAALSDADCERVNEPEDRPEWGLRVARIRDPDGTLFELNEPLE